MNLRRVTFILAAVLMTAVTPLPAQAPVAPEAHVSAMARLSFLLGRWEGGGSIEPVPGQRHTFTSVEEVHLHVDGLVLTVEGIHFARLAEGQRGPKIHHAFATLRYDASRGDYAITATRLDGATIEARGRMQDDAFVWGFQDPRAGHLRYTIRLSPDRRWSEIGERSADGVTWTKYFEMALDKV
jgi:hypothetical protein